MRSEFQARTLEWARRSLFAFLIVMGCSETRHKYPESNSVERSDTSRVPVPSDTKVSPGVDSGSLDVRDASGDTADAVSAADTHEDTAGPEPLEPLPARVCEQSFVYDSLGESVETVVVAGEFNGWSTASGAMSDADGDGIWEWVLDVSTLVPGGYGYKLIVDGQWILDPKQPMRKFVDGTENSKVRIHDCRRPQLELESLQQGSDVIQVVVAVRDGADSNGLLADSAQVVLRGQLLSESGFDLQSQRFTLTVPTLESGKYSLLFSIANEAGAAEPLFLPIWAEETSFHWSDSVMYFAMVDRFFDGDADTGEPEPCLPADNLANWQGGDWAGVRQKIESGYFDALGVNTIWLSAVIDNPGGCDPGSLGKLYTSYHGYFPSAQRVPEEQLGTLSELRALVDAAHARGIRVLVDFVANHLHEEHPLVSEHATDGWFHDYFACGFEEAPLSCWFESYLPDINYQNDAAVEEMVDSALWWIREADLDGFRVDAVKHMHDSLLRTLRARIKAEVETIPDSVFYLVGETFTGDWGGGGGPNESIIKQYISPDLLHGQFDFPLYWRVLRVFARDEAPPSHVAEYLAQNSSYFGSQAVMGTFVGNHDVPRFISHAAGDIADLWGTGSKQQGWDAPPGTPAGSEAYERMALAFSLLFTVEGVPLIYYGDEVGLPGAGDPDNRRPMVFEGWSESQQSLHAHISALASVRAQQPTLRRGSYETLHTDEAVLAFRRDGESGVVIVILNCSESARSLSLALAESSSWKDALSGEEFSVVGEQLTVGLPAWSTRILLP